MSGKRRSSEKITITEGEPPLEGGAEACMVSPRIPAGSGPSGNSP